MSRKTRSKDSAPDLPPLGDLQDAPDDDAWLSAADALAEALAQQWEQQGKEAELDAKAKKRLAVLRKPSGRWVTVDAKGRDPQD